MENSLFVRALNLPENILAKQINEEYEWKDAAWLIPTIRLSLALLLILSIPLAALNYAGKGLLWVGNKLLADEFTRRKGRELQSPIVTYRQPKTGRQVVVYGMIHLGEDAYYNAVKNDLAARADYHVLHEGSAITKATYKKLSRAEREWWHNHWEKVKLKALQLSALGLRLQPLAMPRQPHWEPCDLSLKGLIRLSMAFNVDLINISNFKMNAALASLSTAGCLDKLRQLFRPSAEHKAIIMDRDRIVGDRIEQLVPLTDVAVIYGAGHLPGIQKRLKRLGFRRERVQWLTCYRIKDTLEALLCEPFAPVLATQLMANIRGRDQ